MALPPWIRPLPNGVAIDLLVQPRASREGLGPAVGDRLKVRVHAPPVEGEANAAVVRVVAAALGVPRAAVEIVAGRAGRRKGVVVSGMGAEAAAARLGGAG